MERWRTLLEAIALGSVCATIGGIAKAAKTAQAGGVSLGQIMLGLPGSIFAGVLVQLFIHDAGMSVTVQAGVVATAGYMGGAAVELVVEVVTDLIKRQGQK